MDKWNIQSDCIAEIQCTIWLDNWNIANTLIGQQECNNQSDWITDVLYKHLLEKINLIG